MNTKDDWQTTVTIHDEHRAAVWGKIFPGARMPILSIVPSQADLPGQPGARVYMLDLNAITDEQRDQLVHGLAEHFGIDPEEVRQELGMGVPILTDDTSVESTDQGLMMSLIDDDDDDDPDNTDSHGLTCTCETCIQDYPERMIYIDDDGGDDES